MSDSTRDIASVVDRTRPVAAGGPVFSVHFLGAAAAFVLGEEALVLAAKDDEPHRCDIHGGAILACAADGKRIVTGGDDGKVMATDGKGVTTLIVTDQKRRWIDHVALGKDGAIAWSAGKQAFVRTEKASAKDPEKMLEVPSTVGALAFSPKGFRLAVAHYNGATLWFPNVQREPERFDWKGSHLVATFSPDARFLVTAMQESTLHGWRVADHKDMRMQGYSERVRSLDWSHDGDWLATSGSNQLILWPFQGKDGPMGKAPQIMAQTEHQVQVVACHPRQAITAVGFADGMVLLVRHDDGAEVLAKRPGDAPVSALAWSQDGTLLAFGTESGEAGIVDLG
jgi:WD40 repeat protein